MRLFEAQTAYRRGLLKIDRRDRRLPAFTEAGAGAGRKAWVRAPLGASAPSAPLRAFEAALTIGPASRLAGARATRRVSRRHIEIEIPVSGRPEHRLTTITALRYMTRHAG
jgi:hypothetical protein